MVPQRVLPTRRRRCNSIAARTGEAWPDDGESSVRRKVAISMLFRVPERLYMR
jgi:hypothetical protein